MRQWLAVFEEDDYPGWAYLLVVLTLGIAIKPIEWFFEWVDK